MPQSSTRPFSPNSFQPGSANGLRAGGSRKDLMSRKWPARAVIGDLPDITGRTNKARQRGDGFRAHNPAHIHGQTVSPTITSFEAD